MTDQTSGEWIACDTNDNSTQIMSEQFDGLVLATVHAPMNWTGPGTSPVQTANAKLIVAAPALLSALRAVGHNDRCWCPNDGWYGPDHSPECYEAQRALAAALGTEQEDGR